VHLTAVDDIIAIRVTFDDQPTRIVLTWGRIQDRVDPSTVEQLVGDFISPRGIVRSCTMCTTLQEASLAPYFYESLFAMAQQPIPFGEDYEAWRAGRDEAMRAGKGMWDCGAPDPDVRNMFR
jgi:hypothetical protein